MNNWKAVGYVCLGVGSVILIFGLFVFLTINAEIHQIIGFNQIAATTSLITASPYFITAVILYIIGGIGLYMGSNYEEESIVYSEEVTDEDLLGRLNRLEGIVDNNFNVITKRLDEIEEKQNITSQNTIIKAKRES